MTGWIRRHPLALTLAAVTLFSGALRIATLAESVDGPALSQHRWSESDMHTFDSQAKAIAAGDWLSRDVEPPLHTWHRVVADRYLAEFPDERAALDSDGRKSVGGDPAAALWDRWVGGGRYYQEPLYPHLVALTYAAFGPDVRAVFSWQLALGILTNLLLVVLTWRVFGPAAGVVAGILASFYGPTLYFELVLLRETAIVFATAGLSLCVVEALRAAEAGRRAELVAFLTGLALGAAILLKTIFLPFAVAAIALLGLSRRMSPGRAWRAPALAALGIALVALPLVARNLSVGAPALSVYGAGGPVFAAYAAWSPDADPGTFRVSGLPAILRETDGALLATAWRALSTHPSVWDLLSSAGSKLAATFHWYEAPDNANFYLYRDFAPALRWAPIGFGVVAPLALVGMLLALRLRRRGTLVLYLMVALHLAALALLLVRDRYRLPLVPALIPFAAFGVVDTLRRFRERELATALAATVAASGLALWMARPLPEGSMRVRPIDFRVAFTTHTQPAASAAAAAGETEETARALARLLEHQPDEIRNLGPSHPARSGEERDFAELVAHLYDAYAVSLDRDARPQEASEARSRAQALRAAAGGRVTR